MSETLRVERDGPVLIVTIDRPGVRNAVDRPTADALVEAFLAFERDDSLSAAVLAGAGGHFCAGADLKAIAGGTANRVEDPDFAAGHDRLDGTAPMGPTRMLLSKPVIAAISGYAVAGGFELAIWCDLRVVEADATFGIFCRRWNIPLIDGGSVRLPRLIGLSRALDLIMTGRPVGAAEALAMGLANRVVPSGEGRAEAVKLAHELARLPQESLRHERLSAYEQFDLDFRVAMANEWRLGKETLRVGQGAGAARFVSGEGRGGSSAS
ncbi:MAG: crotonase/enoyl-CoA hydratase family protein [Alphaproteobacteria bacterium]|nr:crotonase/enoyl-CoA hydratase family protein [Alphaproteobacteria bacterium]